MPSQRTKKAHEARGLPAEGFVRIARVLEAVPVSKSAWYRGIRLGLYPAPVKIGPRMSAWRVEDIRQAIARFGDSAAA